ncbi:MAG: glycosyltransferase, partial [bacterium]
AFDAAFGDSPDVHLLLVGDGEEEQGYRKVAAESRSRARIQFLGHSDRVADLMRMSDVFVLPSDNEGLARTLMEAMSSGLLAVSTRTPGSTELIRSEVNGFLCETSVESLTEALARCRQLPNADRIRMTSRARDMISTEFRLDNRVRQALNLLDLPAIPIPAESGKLS